MEGKIMLSSDFVSMTYKMRDNILLIDITPKEQYAEDNSIRWAINITTRAKNSLEQIAFFDLSINRHYEIELKTSGNYSIFMYVVRNGVRYPHIRKSCWYYSDDMVSAYQKFLGKDLNYQEEKLPLAQRDYPYQNIALVVLKANQNSEMIQSSFPEYKCNEYKNKNSKYIVLSQAEPLKLRDNSNLFFSGNTKYNKRLILGQNDIPKDVDTDILLDEVGNWTAIYINKGGVSFCNDYFGMSPFYKYVSSKITVISNSYHLILCVLKSFRIKLCLDSETAIPYFIAGQRQYFEQLASHDTFVKEIKKVPIHNYYYCDQKREEFPLKSIGKTLAEQPQYDENQIEKMVDVVAQEIVENIKMVLEDDRFERVLCDVTGGMDSRSVLAALLRNDSELLQKKVRINSLDVPGSGDKDIFIRLNHIHNLQYEDTSGSYSYVSIKDSDHSMRSIFLGQNFKYGLASSVKNQPNVRTANLYGTGEGIYRHYVQFDNVDYSDETSLAESVLENWNNGFLNVDKIGDYVVNVIANGIKDVIGVNLQERLSLAYLYYRSIYHFGLQFTVNESINHIYYYAPLYSKTALKLQHILSLCSHDATCQFRVIDKLNPLFFRVPFQKEKNNQELRKLFESGNNFLDERFKNICLKLDDDDSEWKTATEKRTKGKKLVPTADDKAIMADNERFYKEYYNQIIGRFNFIVRYDSMLDRCLGNDLYICLQNNKDKFSSKNIPRDLVCITKKITALYDIIQIIKD